MCLFEIKEPEDFGVGHFQADLKMFKHDGSFKFVNSGLSTSNKKGEAILNTLFKVLLSEIYEMFRDQFLHMFGHKFVDGFAKS
jgi:hypothetical protein